MIKIANKEEIKKMQKKIIKQILQKIADVSTSQRNLIMSFCKLNNKDISLHAVSSNAWANLKKTQEWAKEIANSTCILQWTFFFFIFIFYFFIKCMQPMTMTLSRRCMYAKLHVTWPKSLLYIFPLVNHIDSLRIQALQWTFAMLTHEVHTTINMNNQKKVIRKLIKNNTRLYENLKILRIVWLKKVAKSKKTHSLLIMKIAIEAIINQLMNVNMLNTYHEYACELFKKNCCITQCFRCQEFDYMIRFCRKNQCCVKCANKHYIKKCMMFLNKRCCINCNENHEFWRCICFKWWQQMKQASEIYRNRSFRYSEASKYNCTFLQFLSSSLSLSSADSMNSSSLMNFLNSMNSSKFTNSFSSMNSSSSTTVVLKTRSLVAHESTWQMIEVKKRRVNHFSYVSSDSEKTSLKQSQKW